MFVITGATGPLNGATTDHLLDRVPAGDIVVVARNPETAQRFAARGIEVRQGDYADPSSLPAAFAGAAKLLLVSSSEPTADAVALHRNAVEAAVAANVGHVFYTSHQGAAADSPFSPARDHAATEELLAESGLTWTSLRNGFYMHTLQWLLGAWQQTGVITVPADGPVSWTAREDAAAGAAALLLAEDPPLGPTTLTANAAPRFSDIADIASRIAGRPIRVETLDPEDWVATQVAAGSEEFMARFTLGIYLAAAGGYFAGTDPRLGALLGREPITVADFLAAE